ncbi:MAG: rhomboid family intramembrane serine protease [Bacteroidales bacterium]|nr:rhomboid family intramembrane serine protease [Bacteroidales bacterium]
MKIENKRLLYSFLFPCIFVLLIWIIYFFEQAMDADWHQWGIYPRSLYGIKGIFTQPLFHSGIQHLFSNSIPLIILGWCLFYFYKELSFLVFPVVWILSGIFTWCIGRESWHIGASGLVYALSFFLFFSGVFRKYIPLLAVSLLVVFFIREYFVEYVSNSRSSGSYDLLGRTLIRSFKWLHHRHPIQKARASKTT